jgi:hypothetical protein
MSKNPHPELDVLLGSDDQPPGEPAPGDLSIEPCSPGCQLPAAHSLWPAWRDLELWRTRVDEELPGEMSRLLPELWQMWRGLELPGEDPAPDASSLDAAVDDGLSREDFALLLEDLYRAVFALGAGWAQSRAQAP